LKWLPEKSSDSASITVTMKGLYTGIHRSILFMRMLWVILFSGIPMPAFLLTWIVDKIISLQQARLNRLVSYLEDERDKRISLGLGANCKSGSASIPRVLEDRKRCDSYQLGNLIYAMNSENMPSTSQSIHEAVGNLEAIAELGTHNPEYNHDACSWNRQMRDWLVDVEEEDLCLKLSSFPGRLPIIALRSTASEQSGRNGM
jgi:hypothetical protein